MIPFSIGWEAGAPPLLDRDPADHVWVEIAIERILARSIEGELETAACREDRRLELAIRLASGSFALGLQLAAPFLVFGFAVNAGIGLLARLMPQLQVFFIAMPINILAGFFLMMLLIGSMMTLFLNFYADQMAHFLS